MTRFVVATPADAGDALDYFNMFHDGFIRTLSLASYDRFEARGVHSISGRLDLDIVFAHYNYRAGEPPADQLVRARFQHVTSLVADLPMAHGEWSIDRVDVEPGVRMSGRGEEACLVARVTQHRLVNGGWTTRDGLRFAFGAGVIEELCD